MAIKVAIIEDQRDVREMLKILVNGHEETVTVADYETAEEAILDLPKRNADVALVDIHLPRLSGIECVRELKSLCPGTQFVMCTSLEDPENIFEALKSGATGYLSKSSSPVKILEAIREVYAGGSPMSSHIARKVVASFSGKQEKPENKELQLLSDREKEILQHLSKGLRYKEIAEKLHLSTETVRTHVRNIYSKLQVNSRTEALNKISGK